MLLIMKAIKRFWWVLLAFFAIGWVVGLFVYDWDLFKYDFNLSLFDVLSLIITSAIGIYVAQSIQTSLERKKVERDIIFARLDYVEKSIEQLINDILQNPSVSTFKVTACISSCRRSWVKSNKIICETYPNSFNNNSNMELTRKLSSCFIKLNQLTSGEEEIDGVRMIEVADNQSTFHERRKAEISCKIDEIKNVIIDLKLIISHE